jgi:uncharacterized protein YuzE
MYERGFWSDELVELRMTWDAEADAGYLHLTDIAPGEAVRQELVIAPGEPTGMGTVVLDFDTQGRLLGIEFLGKRLLPPGLERLAP